MKVGDEDGNDLGVMGAIAKTFEAFDIALNGTNEVGHGKPVVMLIVDKVLKNLHLVLEIRRNKCAKNGFPSIKGRRKTFEDVAVVGVGVGVNQKKNFLVKGFLAARDCIGKRVLDEVVGVGANEKCVPNFAKATDIGRA